MNLLDYLALARTLEEDAFVRAHPDPVLVCAVPPPENASGRAFRTRIEAAPTGPRTNGPADRIVLPIRKRAGAIYADQISVGRTRSCDVCIDHSQISKLHGYFSRDETGRLAFTDTDATNGSSVDGVRLGAKQRIALGETANLSFGSYACELLSPRAFFRFLRRMPAR